MNYNRNYNRNRNNLSDILAAVFGLGIGGLGIVAILIIFLGNVILGAFTWPAAFNAIAQWANKAQDFVWWHGALFAFVPVLGRWWVGLLIFLAFKFFIL